MFSVCVIRVCLCVSGSGDWHHYAPIQTFGTVDGVCYMISSQACYADGCVVECDPVLPSQIFNSSYPCCTPGQSACGTWCSTDGIQQGCPGYASAKSKPYIGGCDGTSNMYCSTSSVYSEAQTFNAAHPDLSAWAYFTTTSGGNEYKCIAYYVDTQGDAWEVTVGAYDTVNPVNNPNCMTKTAFDARNNTDCTHAPNANDTCTTAQYGIPGATTETDECVSGVGDDKGQTGCSN